MPEGYLLDADTIRLLQRDHRTLAELVRLAVQTSGPGPTSALEVALVQCTGNSRADYPTLPADKYPIKFISPSFDQTAAGTETLTTNTATINQRIAYSLFNKEISDGTYCLAVRFLDKWYLVDYASTTPTDEPEYYIRVPNTIQPYTTGTANIWTGAAGAQAANGQNITVFNWTTTNVWGGAFALAQKIGQVYYIIHDCCSTAVYRGMTEILVPSGGDGTDITGSLGSYTFSDNNTVTRVTGDPYTNALRFNGSNQYLDTTTADADAIFDPTADWIVTVNVNPDTTTNGSAVWTWSDPLGATAAVELRQNNTVFEAFVASSVPGTATASSAVTISAGSWYWIQMWWVQSEQKIYISVNDETPVSTALGADIRDDSGSAVVVVGSTYDNSLYWDGDLGMVWNGTYVYDATTRTYIYDNQPPLP